MSKFRIFLAVLTVVASSASYIVARDGIDVGRAIVESRCSAGAFIAHSKKPSAASPDSQADSAVTASASSGQAATTYTPVPVTSANLLPNGSLEARTGANPTGWSSNAYGNNTSNFSNVRGRDSAQGLRIDISKYSDGTADWFGPNVKVTPGGYYQFQDYYRSSAPSRAILQLKDDTGRLQYVTLESVPAASDWKLYTQRFFVPANVSEIMISHPFDRVGWLETDDYSLVALRAPGYERGMVSVTFDDGWRSVYNDALPLMEKYDVVSTQYLASGLLGSLDEYMTPRMAFKFKHAGHEIGSHTVDHADLTKLNDKDLSGQLVTSHKGLDKCFENVTSFAPPYGASDARTIAAVKQTYATSRSTEAGFNSPDSLNPYRLKVQNIRRDTPPAQVAAWLRTAAENKVWLVLVYHQVSDSTGEFSRKLVDFETDMLLLKQSDLEILTMHNAYAKTQTNSVQQ